MKHSAEAAETSGSWISPYDLFCSALACALGLAIGWLDLQTTEVTTTIVSLLGAGFFLGCLLPTAAWRWPVFMVVGLPIMAAFARLTGAATAEPARVDIRIMLVALVFALTGSYAGVLVRRSSRSKKGRSR